MKEKIISRILVFCSIFMILSCGNKSSKNSGYFGELPKLLLEKNTKLEEINQKGEALSKKESAGMEDMGKLMDEYKNIEQEYDRLILDEGQKLINTPIRCSVNEELPYEISITPVIKDMGKKGSTAEVSFKLKATHDIDLGNYDTNYTVYIKCVNKDGTVAKKEFTTAFKDQNEKTIMAGTESEGKIYIYMNYKKPDEVKVLADIDQLTFISQKDYNEL